MNNKNSKKLTIKKANKLLEKAISIGDLSAIDYLLNDSPVKADLWMVSPPEAYDPCYCLLLATMHNQLPVLKYFLEKTDIKKYTKYSGWSDFCNNTDIIDTVRIMYEYIGQTGNIEMAQYMNTQLHLENKYDLFSNAALNNHVELMDFIIENKWLTHEDKENLKEANNYALQWSVKANSKDALNYLLNYYKNEKIKNEDFIFKGLKAAIDGIKKDTVDFDLFNFFYDACLNKNIEKIEKSNFFKEIAEKNNINLFKLAINKIQDKQKKKQIILNNYIYSYATYNYEEKGSIDNYQVLKYVLDNHKSYFNAAEKEKIFFSVIFGKNREIINDLVKYDFIVKGINVNNIMIAAAKYSTSEDTFEFMKEILLSPLSKKINLHINNDYIFKIINENFKDEELINILKLMNENCKLKIGKIKSIFSENENVNKFLKNLQLINKLGDDLEIKNNKIDIKKLKI